MMRFSHQSLAVADVVVLAAALPALLGLPSRAHAMCDVIPGVTREFRGALGSLNRPFAIPGDVGQQIVIHLKPSECNAKSPGFIDLPGGVVREDDYFVTILFAPPGGAPRNAVILSTLYNGQNCLDRVASLPSNLQGATCRTLDIGPPTLASQLFHIRDDRTLIFRFPDTDDLFVDRADVGDGNGR